MKINNSWLWWHEKDGAVEFIAILTFVTGVLSIIFGIPLAIEVSSLFFLLLLAWPMLLVQAMIDNGNVYRHLTKNQNRALSAQRGLPDEVRAEITPFTLDSIQELTDGQAELVAIKFDTLASEWEKSQNLLKEPIVRSRLQEIDSVIDRYKETNIQIKEML